VVETEAASDPVEEVPQVPRAPPLHARAAVEEVRPVVAAVVAHTEVQAEVVALLQVAEVVVAVLPPAVAVDIDRSPHNYSRPASTISP
jgi:hypothetical protein